MSTSILRSFALLTASAVLAAATLTAAMPATADDTELFVGEAVSPPTARPNIMFILDTSGSMTGDVQSQTPYDAGTDFGGPFDDNRIYWATGTDPLPPCEDDDDDEDYDGDGIDDCDNDLSEQWVDEDAFRCAAAVSGLGSAGLAAIEQGGPVAGPQWHQQRSLGKHALETGITTTTTSSATRTPACTDRTAHPQTSGPGTAPAAPGPVAAHQRSTGPAPGSA